MPYAGKLGRQYMQAETVKEFCPVHSGNLFFIVLAIVLPRESYLFLVYFKYPVV
jgi:hypothetical protein